MEIRLDVNRNSDGRVTGTATAAGIDKGLPFSGNLELLARIEELSNRALPDQSGDE